MGDLRVGVRDVALLESKLRYTLPSAELTERVANLSHNGVCISGCIDGCQSIITAN